jgi:para-aminobenzoate synthetase
MHILVIDNYDSFTYNLVQLIGQVAQVTPIVILNDAMSWSEVQKLDFDAIVLSPGPGRADRASDFGLCRNAIEDGRWPILGVCLGHQGIACLLDGRVDYAPVPMHGRISKVYHDQTDLMAGIPSPFDVVRYHSFLVTDLPEGLVATGRTEDGLLMAMRHRTRPLWGVQFHPESIATQHGARLIGNFIRLAAEARPPRARSISSASPPANPNVPILSERRLRLYSRRLAARVDPEAAFSNLYAGAHTSFWLDSSSVIEGLSRYSFMGDARGPQSEVITYRLGRCLNRSSGKQTEELRLQIFDFLEANQKPQWDCPGGAPHFPFLGGYVGYLGYELKAETGGGRAHASGHPDSQFIFADRLIAFDHETSETWLICLDSPDQSARAEDWLDTTERALNAIGPLEPITLMPETSGEDPFELLHDKPAYLDLIRQSIHEIFDGESYEICLTSCSTARLQIEPVQAYRALRQANSAPYGAYLRFEDLHVLSCSPERFARIDRQGEIVSKPIKGTIRRSSDVNEDSCLKRKLLESEKDRAENLMIVDLIRNDLGKVCAFGSVETTKFCEIETYATVHQMVSTIRGQLREQVSPVACVRAMFPGGSMTGAPKVRTMEIIDRLEGMARGIYSGAIGYFSIDGAVDLNIVIRTVVLDGESAAIGAGGALVALSDPEQEYEEVLLKSRIIRETLARIPGAVAGASGGANKPEGVTQ